MKTIKLKDGREMQPNSYEFMVELLEDMRKTERSKTMVLNMMGYALRLDGKCYACAGGSMVIHGMGGSRNSCKWSDIEYLVARWCDAVRRGAWESCERFGWPVPQKAQGAFRPAMRHPIHAGFWPAWERFKEAFK